MIKTRYSAILALTFGMGVAAGCTGKNGSTGAEGPQGPAGLDGVTGANGSGGGGGGLEYATLFTGSVLPTNGSDPGSCVAWGTLDPNLQNLIFNTAVSDPRPGNIIVTNCTNDLTFSSCGSGYVRCVIYSDSSCMISISPVYLFVPIAENSIPACMISATDNGAGICGAFSALSAPPPIITGPVAPASLMCNVAP